MPPVNLHRTNQAWLAELCGERGATAQQQAHLDLANYLYIVAYNYLLMRQSHVAALIHVASEDLAALAQDFVQDTLAKLAADHFARLRQYQETGQFSSWAAQIIRNQIAGELRKAAFTRPQIDLIAIEEQPTQEIAHDLALQQQEATSALQACIQHLPDHYRLALVQCVAERQPTHEVAALLQKSVDAVHLLIMRAKRLMKQCLESKGFGKEVLQLFP
jgi:RNA polymerase sigma factor (sigma-70 family)